MMFDFIGRIISASSNVMATCAAVIIIVMMFHISADVALRYILNIPIKGTLELVSAYYMVAIVFLPLAYVTRSSGHILVELFTSHLPKRKLVVLETIVAIVGFAYMAAFAWHTAVAAIESTVDKEGWETADGVISVWPSRWLLPLGCGLMAVYLLQRVVTDFRGARGEEQ